MENGLKNHKTEKQTVFSRSNLASNVIFLLVCETEHTEKTEKV